MSSKLLRILMQQRRGVEVDERTAFGDERVRGDTDVCTYDRRSPITRARLKPSRFVELDRRQNDGYTVTLEWDRDSGETQVVVADARTANQLVFTVPGPQAGDAFRHPFRYAL